MAKQLTFQDVNNVMDNFDFFAVHAYMKLTNWTWWYQGDPDKKISSGNYIPTQDETRHLAREFLIRVLDAKEEVSAQGAGGFMAYKFPWGLKLTFEPFKSSTY